MFDYIRNMQLAMADTARRSALKAGAGSVAGIGLGFLIAALWSFLAVGLGWGPTAASAAIGCGFVAIGAVIYGLSRRIRHAPPTTDDLKAEVDARVSMAADAAATRAQAEAARLVDMAGNRVQSLVDRASFGASKVVTDTERAAKSAARQAEELGNSNIGSMTKLIGAFAVGMTLASHLQGRRRGRDDDDLYDDFDDDFDRDDDRYS